MAALQSVALKSCIFTIIERVLEPFGIRKAVLLALLSAWLPAILFCMVFGVHPELNRNGSVQIAGTLLAVYVATLAYAEIGSYVERHYSYPGSLVSRIQAPIWQ